MRVETPYGFEDSDFLDYVVYEGQTFIVRARAWSDSIIIATFWGVCVVRSLAVRCRSPVAACASQAVGWKRRSELSTAGEAPAATSSAVNRDFCNGLLDPACLGGLFEETENSELPTLAMKAWYGSVVQGQRLRLFQFIHQMDGHPVLEVVAHDVRFVNLPLIQCNLEGAP